MHFRRYVLIVCIVLLFCLISAGSENDILGARFERMGPFGGDVRSLLTDAWRPEITYLGTSNGMIFKSSDSGHTWSLLYPGIGRQGLVIDTLVQHPSERNHIFAGAWDLKSDGGGLFESRDAGLTWKQVALPNPSPAIRGLSICRSKPAYMITGTLEGPYVTADGGRTWRQVGGNDLQKAESVAIDPKDFQTLYVGTWRLGYRSSDFGKTWTRVDKGMPLDSDVFSISIDPENPAIVYSSACSGVYRSGNGARLWTRLRLVPGRFTVRAHLVHIDPAKRGRVYSGTTEGLFVSNNDGKTWNRLTSSGVVVNALQVNPENNQQILLGTEYQGVMRSEDGGRTWKNSNNGFIHHQISWIVPKGGNPGGLVAGLGSGSGGMYSFNPEEDGWSQSQISAGMRIHAFLVLPEKRGKLAGTARGLYWQPGEGAPWTKMKGSIAKRAVYSLALDARNPVVYAGTDQGIYRSSLATPALDFRLPPGYRLSPQVWCLTAPGTGTGLVFAGSSLGLLRSRDRGTIWNVVSTWGLPGRTAIESIAVSPTDDKHMFAGTTVGLYESTNGGVHWRRAGNDAMGVHIPSVIFLDDSGRKIMAADRTAGGVFYSEDGGQAWKKISPEHKPPVTCLALDPEQPARIYLGTLYDGVYSLDLP